MRLVQRIVRALGPYGALVITLLVGLVLAFGLAAIAAQVYDNVTDADGVAGLDRPLLIRGRAELYDRPRCDRNAAPGDRGSVGHLRDRAGGLTIAMCL